MDMFGGGGLIEVFNCGHTSDSIKILAMVAGVAYNASHEIDSLKRNKCAKLGAGGWGRKYLDKPRDFDLKNDP